MICIMIPENLRSVLAFMRARGLFRLAVESLVCQHRFVSLIATGKFSTFDGSLCRGCSGAVRGGQNMELRILSKVVSRSYGTS